MVATEREALIEAVAQETALLGECLRVQRQFHALLGRLLRGAQEAAASETTPKP
jgi:hypothetical protein